MRATTRTPNSVVPRILDSLRSVAARLRPQRITPAVPPLSVTDAEGRRIDVRPYRDDDFAGLAGMYDDFDPAQRAQGIPPVAPGAVREWLPDLLEGVNVVALHDDRVVGHVTFVPDGTGRHELATFVHQAYQQAGVGSRLLGAGLGHAERTGVEYVWLTVEKGKRYQQRFYSRAGFASVDPMGVAHRMSRQL